jgi:hypothetical protein
VFAAPDLPRSRETLRARAFCLLLELAIGRLRKVLSRSTVVFINAHSKAYAMPSGAVRLAIRRAIAGSNRSAAPHIVSPIAPARFDR